MMMIFFEFYDKNKAELPILRHKMNENYFLNPREFSISPLQEKKKSKKNIIEMNINLFMGKISELFQYDVNNDLLNDRLLPTGHLRRFV